MDLALYSQIADHLTRAIGPHATKHSAALLFVSHSSAFALGTATCVEVGGHFLLATAGHNFDSIPSGFKLRIVPPSRGLDEAIPTVAMNNTGDRGNSAKDLAWVEVDPVVAAQHGLSAIPVDQVLPFHRGRSDALYLVHGLPHERAVYKELDTFRKISLASLSYLTDMADDANTSAIDLPLTYDKGIRIGTGTEIGVPEPHGCSGGGIWIGLNSPGHSVWSSHLCLMVGIVRGYQRQAKRLVGIQMQHWLELVRADIPDTSAAVGAVLERG